MEKGKALLTELKMILMLTRIQNLDKMARWEVKKLKAWAKGGGQGLSRPRQEHRVGDGVK